MIKVETYLVLMLFFVLFSFSCKNKSTEPPPVDNRDILEKLEELEEIDVQEIEPQNGYPRQFEINITQPADHNNPDGAKFNQQLFLSHQEESFPVIFMPTGYAARAKTQCELSLVMESNQIQVTHRYMLGARR